jgi:hypothetical protein
MKKIYFSLFFYHIVFLLYSQNPTIDWEKTIGGNQSETPYKIKQTLDNGYVVGGTSNSGISGDKSQICYGSVDFWIVKLNTNGSIQWEKTFGGNLSDEFKSIIQTNDGGYLIGGTSNSSISNDKSENSRGGMDYWIVKLDANGTILWDKTYGGNLEDNLTDIQKTNDGGYILAGYSNSSISGDKTENSRGLYDYWILKINAEGAIMWQKTIGGDNYDFLRSVKQLNDNSYILAGRSFSGVSGDRTSVNIWGQDAWIIRVSSTGEIIWQKKYNLDDITTIISSSDGNLVIAGSNPLTQYPLDKSLFSYSFQSTIFKINLNGDILWSHYNQLNGGDCIANGIVEANDGYYYATYSSNYSTNKAFITKLNFNGNLVWNKAFSTQSGEFINSLDKTNDNAVVCAIQTSSNSYGDKSENSKGLSDYWVVKLNPSLLNSTNFEKENFKLFPNPVNDLLNIYNRNSIEYKTILYNALGQEIRETDSSDSNFTSLHFDYAPGYYFLKVINTKNSNFETFKINKL